MKIKLEPTPERELAAPDKRHRLVFRHNSAMTTTVHLTDEEMDALEMEIQRYRGLEAAE